MDKLKIVVNQHHKSLEPEITGWPIFSNEPEQVTIYKGKRAYVVLLGETVMVETWNTYENGDLGRVLSTTEIPNVSAEEQLEFPFVKEL